MANRAVVTWLAFETPSVGARRAVITWLAFEAPAVQGGVTAAAPTLPALTLFVFAPSITAGAAATFAPVLLALTATVQAPSITTTRMANVQPEQQVTALTLQTPTVTNQRNASVTPAQLVLAVTNNAAPTVSTGTGATLVADQVSVASSVLTPSVVATRAVTVAPALVVASVAVLDPAVSAGGSAAFTAEVLDLAATLFSPAVSATRGVTVSVQPIDVTVAIPDPPVVVVQSTSSVTVGASQFELALTAWAPLVTTTWNAAPTTPLLVVALELPAPTVVAEISPTIEPSILGIALAVIPPAVVGLPVNTPGLVGLAILDVALVSVAVIPDLGGAMPDIGDVGRFGNARIDPATGQPLASPPLAFTTGGVATDPTTVTILVQKPDGTVLEFGWPADGPDGPALRESTGRFYADVAYDQSSRWRCRIEGTGAVSAAAEGEVRVSRQRVQVAA